MTPLLAQRPRADRAFERLYRKHVHAVYRYALAVLHNEADAEDVTQTAFLSAYRAFQRGERPERPHNWLIKIAHNVCRQRFRDSSRRPQEVAFDESLAGTTVDDSDTPTATEIRRALGFLGFNQRAALVMRELEGRSYAEIAQILDVSVGAVETLIFRARRALREQLEGGLTCAEAELTLSRLQEQQLSSAERGSLRAHLRECKDCALLERRSRAQRAAIKGIAAIPLPPSLATFFGGGAAGGSTALAGGGLGAKVAAVLAAGVIAGGLGHEAFRAVADAESGQPAAAAAPAASRGFSSVATLTAGRELQSLLAARADAKSRQAKRAAGRRGHARKAGAAHAQPGTGGNAGATTPGAIPGGAISGGPAGVVNTIQPIVSGVQQPALPVRVPPLPPPPPVSVPIPLPPPPPLQLPPPPPLPLPPPPPIP